MSTPATLREQLVQLLEWADAHCEFDRAVADFPVELRGKVPKGLPYSAWQLLEHMRICQRDILDFCREREPAQLQFPDDYWPRSVAPPDVAAWDASVKAYRADRAAFIKLIRDPGVDLLAGIPADSSKSFIREVLLLADHNSYHIGQIVYVRRLLGAWKD